MTRVVFAMSLSAAIAGCASTMAKDAADPAVITSVAHLDIAKSGLDEALAYLRDYVAASKSQPGAIRIELLRQVTNLNHFTMVEVWADHDAYVAHLASPQARAFHAKLDPLLGSPHDERLFANDADTAMP